MPVTLDLELSLNRFSGNARQSIGELNGIASAAEEVGESSKKAMGVAAADQEKLNKSLSGTSSQFDKQARTVQQLSSYLERLSKGQKKATDPKTIKKYNTEIAKTRAALKAIGSQGPGSFNKVNKGAKASQKIFNSLKGSIAGAFAPLALAGAAIAGIRSLVSAVSDFEQGAADLSAITGATGDTLEFLKQQAVEVGVETTISAGDTLEAYKLIASAKPELLTNAEALASITREAIALTEAMGGDLPTAATNLTDIMNKFNASADQAPRFVNALAAGSKEGSADVESLAASILVAGTEASSSNIAFEETIGTLETLAERGLKGAEAGTALRNVLSKLSATDVLPKDATDRLRAAGVDITQLSDKTITLSDRLRALAPIQNDANALTALFGLENKAAATILLQNIERVDELTESISGTNVAYEQAAVRTKTLAGEFARLKNTIQSLIQGGGGGLSTLLASIVRFIREGVLILAAVMRDLAPTFNQVRDAIGEVIGVFASLIPVQNEATEGTSILSTIIKAITVPIKLMASLIAFGAQAVARFTTFVKNLITTIPGFSTFINTAKDGFFALIQTFINLPSYLAGSIASIKTFIVEVAKGIGRLGKNIGTVLSEAFSFRKLLFDGTADLFAAVDELLVNPFGEVGSRSAQAFQDAFARNAGVVNTIQDVEIEAEETPAAITIPTVSVAASAPDFVDPQEAEREREKLAREALRRAQEFESLRLASLKEGVDKQLELEDIRYNDLVAKLEEYGLDTAEVTRQYEQNRFNIRAKFIREAADLENLAGEERIQFIFDQTTREIDALEAALRANNQGELLEDQQKQINLLRRKASEEYLNNLESFQSEEQRLAEQHEINLLELRRDEFDSQLSFEEFKQKELLDIRLKYAEQQLALLEELSGAESDAALSVRRTINEIKGELANFEAGVATGVNIYSLLGLDPDDERNQQIVESINTATSKAIDLLGELNNARIKAVDNTIKANKAEIASIDAALAAKRTELGEEESLADQGLANNVDRVQQEIATLQEQRLLEQQEADKALEQKRRIQKEQAILDTLTQGSSLISASAQIFNSVAAIPFVGPIIGAGLVTLMLGSFAAAKAKVFQNINSKKAEKGIFTIIRGKRHSQGGEPLGNHIEAEDGEAVGVLSRAATRSSSSDFEAFVNATNKGDRKAMASIADRLAGGRSIDRSLTLKVAEREAGVASMKTEINVENNKKELNKNNALLEELIRQGKKQRKTVDYAADGSKIESQGSYTRRVRNA
mgnify:CR=1 FL=1